MINNSNNDNDCDAVKDNDREEKKVIDVIVLEPVSIEIINQHAQNKNTNPLYQSAGTNGNNPIQEGKQVGGALPGAGIVSAAVSSLQYSSNGIFTTNDLGKKAFAIIPSTFALGSININNNMPNRISMNVTVAKQTQGATFGERLSKWEHSGDPHEYLDGIAIGEPGVNTGDSPQDAAKQKVEHSGDPHENINGKIAANENDGTNPTSKKVVEKATSGLKDTLKTQVRMSSGGSSTVTLYSTIIKTGIGSYAAIGTMQINGKTYPVKVTLKTKHDTAKNSISNIR